MSNIKDKLAKLVLIATITAVSTALVAWLKDPENRLFLKLKAKEYRKVANKQIKVANKKLAVLKKKYQK